MSLPRNQENSIARGSSFRALISGIFVFWIICQTLAACHQPNKPHDAASFSPDSVWNAKFAKAGHPPGPFTIYLSFDDGPLHGSAMVNETAAADSLKITVFVIGKFVLKDEETRQLFRSYQQNPFIEIGNHSFSHANGHYKDYYEHPDMVKNDFLQNEQELLLQEKIARLPGRNCWRLKGSQRIDLPDAGAAADSLAANHYRIFGWDLEWHYDSSGRIVESAEEIYQQVNQMIEHRSTFTAGNLVLLCHDPMLADSFNVQAFKLFIQKIRASGNYRFDHLSQYPDKKLRLEPGAAGH